MLVVSWLARRADGDDGLPDVVVYLQCAVISPRFDVCNRDLEKWTTHLLPSRQFGSVCVVFMYWLRALILRHVVK